MTATTAPVGAGLDIGQIADAIAPKKFRTDPFGLFSGYRAYLVYTRLDAMADHELAAIGLDRRDIPQVAFDAAFGKSAS